MRQKRYARFLAARKAQLAFYILYFAGDFIAKILIIFDGWLPLVLLELVSHSKIKQRDSSESLLAINNIERIFVAAIRDKQVADIVAAAFFKHIRKQLLDLLIFPRIISLIRWNRIASFSLYRKKLINLFGLRRDLHVWTPNTRASFTHDRPKNRRDQSNNVPPSAPSNSRGAF